jgi:hypothetical protein
VAGPPAARLQKRSVRADQHSWARIIITGTGKLSNGLGKAELGVPDKVRVGNFARPRQSLPWLPLRIPPLMPTTKPLPGLNPGDEPCVTVRHCGGRAWRGHDMLCRIGC